MAEDSIVLDELLRGFRVVNDRDNRRVNGHVIRASAQSPLAGIDIARLTSRFASLRTFTPQSGGDSVNISQIAFDHADIFQANDEKQLQARFCGFLKKTCGLSLPAVKDVRAPVTRAHPTGGVHQEVSESTMSNPLEMYGENAGLTQGRPKKLRRVSLGLQVTTSSLCDVSVHVDTGNGGDHQYQVELAVGELKHRDTYTTAQCIAQASLYMQTVFYWLRVELGLPVRSVYGFAVCGPRCSDVEHYTITLLKITAPAKLGDPFIYERHTLVASSLRDKVPMETLVNFLKHGHRSLANLGTSVPGTRRAPTFFSLPLSFWHDLSPEYKLVRGGTVAIVFRATWKGVQLLLSNNPLYRPLLLETGWGFRLSEWTRNFLRGQRFPYVVKFQVAGVSNGVSYDFCTLDRDKFSAELKETYPIRAGITRDSYCLVMRNRGDPVNEDTFSSYDEIKSAFRCVYNTVLELCTMLPPCDTLVHNMVYDGQYLHLIDVDEGWPIGVTIKERIMDEDKAGGYATFLNYPNRLRDRHEQYALVQMAVSFVALASMNNEVKLQAQKDSDFAILVQNLENLGRSLSTDPVSIPFQPNAVLPPRVATPLAAIDQTMAAWFL